MSETQADKDVTWHHESIVRPGFSRRAFVARFVLPFLPPITSRTFVAWGTFPVLIALMIAWVWYANVNFVGNGSTPTTIRWMAYICGALVVLFGGLLPSRGVESPQMRRAGHFQAGKSDRALVRGGRYGFRRGKVFTSVKVDAVRGVRRLQGIVALELPSGRHWLVPAELFPDDFEWAEIKRRWAAENPAE